MRRRAGIVLVALLFGFAAVALVSLLFPLFPYVTPSDVRTGRNDAGRTGANLQETFLTPDLVENHFGKLFSYPVEGFVYAQPLIVSGLDTPLGRRNVLFVATTRNKLYAFDADSNAVNGGLIWEQDLTPPGASLHEDQYRDHLAPSVGILGTPTIDRESGTLYAVSRAFKPDSTGAAAGTYIQQLHARALRDGSAQRPPATIAASVNGKTFDSAIQINRPGLALANGLVIIAWNTFFDKASSAGWVMAYDATTLEQKGVFCTSCSVGWGGNIWQSGRPPAVDSQYAYFFTANGSYLGSDKKYNDPANSCVYAAQHPAKPVGYFGELLVRLDLFHPELWQANQGVASWTPYNWCELEQQDTDLGGSGPMLIPGISAPLPSWGSGPDQTGPTTVAIGGGKEGILYAIDTARVATAGLVEWMAPGPNQRGVVSAINECVDFDSESKTLAPPNGTGVDIPGKWPAPPTNVVNLCPINEDDNHSPPPDPKCLRPLCAQDNVQPDSATLWGERKDHLTYHIMGGPVFWPNPQVLDASLPKNRAGTGMLYVEPENLPLVAYEVRDGHIMGIRAYGHFGDSCLSHPRTVSHHPGGILALSADGHHSASGVVWVSHFADYGYGSDAVLHLQEGVLEAFDATTLRLLWTSESTPQDRLGGFAKFTPPTIANGKVYVAASPAAPGSSYAAASSGGAVVVYGYLRDASRPPCYDLGPQQRPWDGLIRDPGPLLTLVALISIIVTLATVFVVGQFRSR